MPPDLIDARERELAVPRVNVDVVKMPVLDEQHHAPDRVTTVIHDLSVHVEDRHSRVIIPMDESDRGAAAVTRAEDLRLGRELAA